MGSRLRESPSAIVCEARAVADSGICYYRVRPNKKVTTIRLFSELKRRNVLRVLTAYLVGSWVIAQVADLVLPNFGAPVWVVPLIIRLLAIGFPVVFFFAWAFQITPNGIKRHKDVDYDGAAVRSGSKMLNFGILAGVVAIAVMVGVQQVRELSSQGGSPLAQTASRALNVLPSIAVMAFDNLSTDPSNAFFAEGISEEILNVLARIKGMRVASRTSAFSFAGSNVPVREIGTLLDVEHVLAGSVRKQGDMVRISAQLIDAATDTSLWSRTYDRKLIDIFVVQEEIGKEIAKAMMGALGMRQVAVAAPTEDLAAYGKFLEARVLFYERGAESLSKAIQILETVVELDAEFADAWSLLAAANVVARGYGTVSTEQMAIYERDGSEAAARALALDLGQALAVAAQAQLLPIEQMPRTLELIDQAARMAPQDANLQMWAGNFRLVAGGYPKESVPLLQRAYTLDPLVGINNGMLGSAYLALGQRELGRQHVLRAAELGWPHAMQILYLDLVHTGETDAAVAALRSTFPEDESTWTEYQRGQFSVERRTLTRAFSADDLAAIEEQVEASGTLLYLPFHYYVLGDLERAFDEAESAPEKYDLFFRLSFSPAGRKLVEHPRFIRMADMVGISNVWPVKGNPMGCVRVQDEIGDHFTCSNWPD